jgi:hypothetical protein
MQRTRLVLQDLDPLVDFSPSEGIGFGEDTDSPFAVRIDFVDKGDSRLVLQVVWLVSPVR